MKKSGLLVWYLALTLKLFCKFAVCEETHSENIKYTRKLLNGPAPAVNLYTTHQQVVLDNSLLNLTLSNPEGDVIGVTYQGVHNLLETRNAEDDRGYLDVVWGEIGQRGTFERIKGTTFKVAIASKDQVEVSFSRTWNLSLRGSSVPLTIDKRYVMLRGSSGFYSYFIFERPEGWPDMQIEQIRIVYKLDQDMFHYMAVSDKRQRIMPMMEDRNTGQPLAFPEAVLLTKPINPTLRGEVDDKYQYSCENKDNRVHGWISSNDTRGKSLGFWMITPSDEFRHGGPIKQDLTSHVGPYVLSMLVSLHYAGKEVAMSFQNGEPYKKIFGPVYVYLNSMSGPNSYLPLWNDAKRQMSTEVKRWPYGFPQSKDFLKADQRGRISGQFLVDDRYIKAGLMEASSAFVGLALPGEVGSWQRESKGYQFWGQTDEKGNFLILNILPGKYNLYAWVPGVIGDYRYENLITITPGCNINLNTLVYKPPRNGPTLWEIGIPDRTAGEFFIPDPYPTLMNQILNNNDAEKFRQYGLWDRYADIYRNIDLVFDVGVHDYTKHWFFAQVTRDIGNKTYQSTTWKIVFRVEQVNNVGNYTLQLALASVCGSTLQVRINDPKMRLPHFYTGGIGDDSAIARHGIHGLYNLFSVGVHGNVLVNGENTIYLTQSKNAAAFTGIMYDYIRLESPPER